MCQVRRQEILWKKGSGGDLEGWWHSWVFGKPGQAVFPTATPQAPHSHTLSTFCTALLTSNHLRREAGGAMWMVAGNQPLLSEGEVNFWPIPSLLFILFSSHTMPHNVPWCCWRHHCSSRGLGVTVAQPGNVLCWLFPPSSWALCAPTGLERPLWSSYNPSKGL